MGPQLTTKAPTHGFRIISSGSPAWPPRPSLATPEHQAYIDFHRSKPGLDSKAARGCTSSHTEKAPCLPSLANPNHGSGEYYYPQAPRHHLNIGSPCAAELRELASSMAFQRRRWRDDRQRRCQCSCPSPSLPPATAIWSFKTGVASLPSAFVGTEALVLRLLGRRYQKVPTTMQQ
jgi:hypothetical protein